MSSAIPANLNERFSTLQGYRKTMMRFYPDRSGQINSTDVLRYTVPKEIILLDSLQKYFEFSSTAAATGTGGVRQGTFFPRNSASIIDTLTVFINGQVFENITNYNHLFNVLYDNTAGLNYSVSGLRAIECADPSIRYTVANASGNAITAAVQGGVATFTTDATACDNKRPLHITNWIGALGTLPKVIDARNVEIVIEIRLAPSTILWKGVAVSAGEAALTPSYTIDGYYMTVQKISFDDDMYNQALDALKASGNYVLTYKTFNCARSGSVDKTTNANLQFSTTAKNLSKLYFTFIDGTFDTISQIQNTSKTTSFSEHIANLRTNVDAFNQSKYFQKNAVSLTEIQCEINGIPCYPFPQPPHLIHNGNYEGLDLHDKNDGHFIGFQSLESWQKYGFLMATSFEHRDAYKNNIITGYPNPSRNLLNIKYSTTFSGSATDKVYLIAWAEKVAQCIFNGGDVSIDM